MQLLNSNMLLVLPEVFLLIVQDLGALLLLFHYQHHRVCNKCMHLYFIFFIEHEENIFVSNAKANLPR